MKRCARCILPETFPDIKFDKNGVCNYCLEYERIKVKGKDEFEKLLSQYRNKGDKADCIVTLSGGRDSTFVLYQLVKVYNMRVLAVTYDNGLLTEEAYRNMQRITEKLNVEHIVIKANKEVVKKNIKKNLLTWLKKPTLGMIQPIFTLSIKVADFHIYRIMKRYKIPLIITGGMSGVEKTLFKTGFLGIYKYTRTPLNDLLLLWLYLLEYIKNPYYFNRSLIANFKGFFVYLFYSYLLKKKTIHFFQYIKWDEKEVISTIRKELNWESPPDTITTWRIDDEIAPIYNFLYYIIVGFTEHDALLSNMIREGMIKREEALTRVQEENRPRVSAINKFLREIGLEMNNQDLEKMLSKFKHKNRTG
jgi:hypothetical protein